MEVDSVHAATETVSAGNLIDQLPHTEHNVAVDKITIRTRINNELWRSRVVGGSCVPWHCPRAVALSCNLEARTAARTTKWYHTSCLCKTLQLSQTPAVHSRPIYNFLTSPTAALSTSRFSDCQQNKCLIISPVARIFFFTSSTSLQNSAASSSDFSLTELMAD